MRTKLSIFFSLLFLFFCTNVNNIYAQEDADELVRQAANPIADKLTDTIV